jgi:type II secretory pathway pseudopilin PulG
MNHPQKGFKLIELIIGIVVILGIVALAIPNFMRSRDHERNAEVKSNVHAIQIALERYAVDSGGYYPTFLVGGDRRGNILRSWIDMKDNGVSLFPADGMTPFAYATKSTVEIEPGAGLVLDRDPLIRYGYLLSYPTNPFTKQTDGLFAAEQKSGGPGIFPYGGLDGSIMFDLGFGWGDTPQTQFVGYPDETSSDPPRLDAPGEFYYHPFYDDNLPVYMHYASIWGTVRGDRDNQPRAYVRPSRPVDYELAGFGPADMPRSFSRGLDYYQAMPSHDSIPAAASSLRDFLGGPVLDSSVHIGNVDHEVETTGYIDRESDPWVGKPKLDRNDDTQVRAGSAGPDGIGDWVIISLSGGGVSVVLEEPVPRYPYGEDQESVVKGEFK